MIQLTESAPSKEIPEWMSHYLINPPEWLLLSVVAAGCLVVILAIAGLVRSGGLDKEVVKEIVTNMTYLASCGGSAWFVMSVASVSWQIAVVLAWVLGSGLAWVLVPQFHLAVEDAFDEPRPS